MISTLYLTFALLLSVIICQQLYTYIITSTYRKAKLGNKKTEQKIYIFWVKNKRYFPYFKLWFPNSNPRKIPWIYTKFNKSKKMDGPTWVNHISKYFAWYIAILSIMHLQPPTVRYCVFAICRFSYCKFPNSNLQQ